MKDSLDEGRIEIDLDGAKLHGIFALFRTAADEAGRARWLLVKKKDEHADPSSSIVQERPESVLSERTIEEVAGQTTVSAKKARRPETEGRGGR